MKISTKLPLEVNLRISELEKALLNIKSLKVGSVLEGKIIKKSGNEATIDFGDFRIKANIKFSVEIGETLKLRIKSISENGKNLVFEYIKDKTLQDKTIEIIGKLVSERDFSIEKLKIVSNEIKNLIEKNPELKADIEKALDEITLKLNLTSNEVSKTIKNIVDLISKTDKENLIEAILKILLKKFINTKDKLTPLKLKSLASSESLKSLENLKHNIETALKDFKNSTEEKILTIKDLQKKIEKLFLESDKNNFSTKEIESVKGALKEILTSIKELKTLNVLIKNQISQNTSSQITAISIVIPFFISNEKTPSELKIDYKFNKKSKNYTPETIMINLSLSSIGRLSIVLEKISDLLKITFFSEKKDVLELLKNEEKILIKRISAFIKNIKIVYRKETKGTNLLTSEFSQDENIDITV